MNDCRRRAFLGLMAALLAFVALAAAPARATDYCIDPVAGDDAATGRCADRAWRTLGPSQTFPFVSGDRVLLSAGRHVHPLTQWYMKPGVSWIGAGRDRTTVVFDKVVSVPFVRFRTGSGGSGPPSDLRPDPFTNATLLADLTLVNEGQAHTGIDVVSTSGDSAPAIARVGVVGFATGVAMHPASDERVAASTHVRLTNSVIRDATTAGLASFADVFYPRAVAEASTMTNVSVEATGVGAVAKTQLQDLRDAANATASPVLTNVTLVGAGEAAMLLVSYYDDGTGARRVTQNAGATGATIRGSILTGSAGHGLREHSAFTEPAVVADSSFGGNALGDYLDEGSTVVPAPSVGTGNVSFVPAFVDRAAGDLHVLAGSPTIDTLAAGSAPPDDVDGQARPQGARSDMGADEWVPCSAVADASASRPAPPCTGGGSTLDSAGSSVDASCTAGMVVEWYQGTLLLSTAASLDVSPAMPTTYRLRVRCADPALSACFEETTVDVEPSTPPPSAGAGLDQQACAAAGEVVVFDLGGTASATPPSTLAGTLWTATTGTIADPSALATTLTVAAPGGAPLSVTATLTATDDAGCQESDEVVLLISPEPTVDITAPAIECHDAGATEVLVAVLADSSGGTGVITHVWTSSEGSIGGDASALLTLPQSPVSRSVDVTVTATDEAGCSATDTVTIRTVPRPVADAGPDGQACGETGSTASAPLDGTGTTGEPPLTWLWSATEGSIADPSAAVTSIELSVGGTPRQVTVTLRVTDSTGTCVSSDERIVTVGPGPVAQAGADTDDCAAPGPARFALDGSASTGVPPLTYAWTTSSGTIADPAAATTFLDVNIGGPEVIVVTLEVQDSRGSCRATDQRVLTVGPGPTAAAGADSAECVREGPVAVALDAGASTGIPPLSYLWTATGGTIADPAAAATSLAVDLASSTLAITATVEVIDARGTCVGRDSREIRLSPEPTADPGGPYVAVQGAGDTRLPIDQAVARGEAPLAWEWTTDLGTFEDTATTTSSLPAPVLLVPQLPAVQRGRVCLVLRTPAGCSADSTCADVTVLLTPVEPPNDVSPTLRVRKAPPADVELSWEEAPVDASHDAATLYDVTAADRGCGPFPRLQRLPAVTGRNTARDPVLLAPPLLRCYVIRSLNDGGASQPAPPDGSACR